MKHDGNAHMPKETSWLLRSGSESLPCGNVYQGIGEPRFRRTTKQVGTGGCIGKQLLQVGVPALTASLDLSMLELENIKLLLYK